jgi:putative salt-induced outer membrane protein YdiY
MKMTYVFGLLAATLLAAAPSTLAADAVVDTNSPPWDISATAGATLTRGNSETLALSANIAAIKKWANNEINLGADGVYGESEVERDDGSKYTDRTAASVHGFAQYNRLFTERFFGYFRVDALNDAEADINYRVSLSPGVGYYFIKEPKLTLRGELGPGYVFEDLGGETDDYATLRVAERGEWKITERAKIWESVEYVPQVDDFANYVVNAEIGLDTAITKKLSQVTFLQDTYRSRPAEGRENNDLKLVAGIKYRF